MAVSTITLESSNGDWVVVSAPNDEYLADDIVLDADPKGMYDTAFKLRTISGAFEIGGRVVGEQIPIREPVLPFWLTKASRPRFQRLWGTPGNFQKVKCTWDGPSGPRFLILRLAKEIEYMTEDGLDTDKDDDVYHAVASTVAPNPMYEGEEDVAEWVNPDDRFTVAVVASAGAFPLTFTPRVGSAATTTVFTVTIVGTGGTFPLTFGGQTVSPEIGYNAAPSAVQAALEALPSVGAGNVTVTGSAGNYFAIFKVAGTLTGSATNLTGSGHSINIKSGIPYSAAPSVVQSVLEALPPVGAGKVTVTGTPNNYLVVFAVGTNGVLTGSTSGLTGTGIGLLTKSVTIDYAPNTGWFDVWSPTDQPLWPEWTFDPAEQWKFPDFSFGQERKWNRAVGVDAARLIVTPRLTQILSVMSDPFMDTYVNADLSNAAGLFNGVEPVYPVPPYTATEDDPVLMPVICFGPAGSKVTLRQRRFWSAESGLEQP